MLQLGIPPPLLLLVHCTVHAAMNLLTTVACLGREAFQGAPSHKFLPLAYQMASRMSASRSGPLFRSRFQHILTRLLVRLSTDHPYHTLYHIMALKNGQLGSDGKIQAGAVHGVLSHAVDVDKVRAAILHRCGSETLVKIGAEMCGCCDGPS